MSLPQTTEKIVMILTSNLSQKRGRDKERREGLAWEWQKPGLSGNCSCLCTANLSFTNIRSKKHLVLFYFILFFCLTNFQQKLGKLSRTSEQSLYIENSKWGQPQHPFIRQTEREIVQASYDVRVDIFPKLLLSRLPNSREFFQPI